MAVMKVSCVSFSVPSNARSTLLCKTCILKLLIHAMYNALSGTWKQVSRQRNWIWFLNLFLYSFQGQHNKKLKQGKFFWILYLKRAYPTAIWPPEFVLTWNALCMVCISMILFRFLEDVYYINTMVNPKLKKLHENNLIWNLVLCQLDHIVQFGSEKNKRKNLEIFAT